MTSQTCSVPWISGIVSRVGGDCYIYVGEVDGGAGQEA